METIREYLPEKEIFGILMNGSNAIIRSFNGTILTWAEGAARLYGWSKAEAVGRSSHELLATQFPKPLNSINVQVAREGSWNGELLHRTKSGVTIAVQSVWTLIVGNDNQQYIVEMNSDISAGVRAREALVAGEQRLRLAQEVAHVGVWDWDATTDTSVCSDEWFEQYGRAPTAFGPQSNEWLQWVHPEDRERVQQALTTAGQGMPYDAEYRVLWPNGEVHWLHAKGQTFLNGEGACVRMIGANIDVTDRKQYEARLQDINQSLQQSNEDLRQFAYAVGHDLKEPLRGVAGCSTLLAKKLGSSSDEETNTFLQYIVQGAERMRDMLDGLLEYARASEQSLPMERVCTGDALKAAAENLQVSIVDSAAEIESGSLPCLEANATALTQVFQNLVGNAIKYRRPNERPRIHVSAGLASGHWIFRVTDNGIGVDPKYQEKIFQLFQRVDHRRAPGAGVGLAVSKRIIERHGGRMWAESQPGVGSTFCFSLPARSGERAGLVLEASAKA